MSSYDYYLRHRQLKPGGITGWHEYESLEEFRHRISGPMLFRGRKRRRFFPRRSSKRRRFTAKPFLVRSKPIGYVRRYKKAAFSGRKRWTVNKIQKCFERKVFYLIEAAAPFTLTHTVGSDFQWVQQPTTVMTQGTGYQQFQGNCIFLNGIKLDWIIGPASGDNDSYFVRICVFRSMAKVNFTAAFLTETSTAGTNKDLQFFDVNYAANSAAWMQSVRPNPNGPKLLYDRRFDLRNTNTVAGTNARRIHVWIPLRHIHRFEDDPVIDTGTTLNTAPNFGKYGDLTIVLSWDNGSHMMGGAAKSLVFAQGSQTRIYYVDTP